MIIPAITILPMATTVAGEEPDNAANIIHATTEAIAKPPRNQPTMAMAKRMIRFATPPVDIKLEANIKNGIANSV